MTIDVTSRRARRIRPRFVVAVLILVTAIATLLCLLNRSVVGGQSADSPDGTYRIRISRRLDAGPRDPYSVVLTRIGSDEPIRRLRIEPVNGRPNQPVREAPRAVEWSEDGRYADITLDGERICRVFVPQ